MSIGMNSTTPVCYQPTDDGRIEARMAFALFGSANMTDKQMEECGHNPFHVEWFDNFVRGYGATEQEALAALEKDMNAIYESIWE